MKYETAHKYISDAESLFGSILRRNKDMTRAILVEKCRELYEKGVNGVTAKMTVDGVELDVQVAPVDLKLSAEMLKLIHKIEMERPEDEENLLEKLQLPDITFTTDPAALVEDIDHEEVDEEE